MVKNNTGKHGLSPDTHDVVTNIIYCV